MSNHLKERTEEKNIALEYLLCRPTKSLSHSEVVGLDYIVLGFGIFDKLACIKTADGRVKVEKFIGKMRQVFKNELYSILSKKCTFKWNTL